MRFEIKVLMLIFASQARAKCGWLFSHSLGALKKIA